MKINFMTINNYSSAKNSSVKEQSNKAQSNIAFSSQVAAKDLLVNKLLQIEKPELLRELKALENVLNGSDNFAKANLLLKLSDDTRSLASEFYGAAGSWENAIVDQFTGKGGQNIRLSQRLKMSFTDLAEELRRDILKKEVKEVKIMPSGIKAEVVRQTQNLEEALSRMTNLGNLEKTPLKDKFETAQGVGETFKSAAIYFRALSAHFYEKAGNTGLSDRYYRESLLLSSI